MFPPSKEDIEIAEEMRKIVLERAGLLTKPDFTTWDGKEMFRYKRNLFAIPMKYAALSAYMTVKEGKNEFCNKQAQLCGVSVELHERSLWFRDKELRPETDSTAQAIQGNMYGYQTPSMTCKNT